MQKQIKLAIAAVGVLLLGLGILASYYFKESREAGLSRRDIVGTPLTTLELETESGKNISLKEAMLGGHGAMLSFWATWCEPCLKEIPKILSSKISAHTKIIWISLDYGSHLDRVKEVESWRRQQNISIETFFDGKGQFSEQLQITGLPLNLLVSAQGKILWSQLGMLSEATIKELEKKSAGL